MCALWIQRNERTSTIPLNEAKEKEQDNQIIKKRKEIPINFSHSLIKKSETISNQSAAKISAMKRNENCFASVRAQQEKNRAETKVQIM